MRYFAIILLFFLTAMYVDGAAYGLNGRSSDYVTGSSQSLSIDDSAQTGLDITTDLSICVWVNYDDTGTYGLAGKRNHTGAVDGYQFLTTNTLYVFNIGNGTSDTQVIWSFTRVTGTWTHACVTYDESAGTADLYVNSVFQSTQSGLHTAVTNFAGVFSIGSTNNTESFMDGLIDEVMVLDDLLTSAEIAELYSRNSQKPPKWDPNLQGYWRLNDSGSILDESGNDNTLDNNASVLFLEDTPWTGNIPQGL